MDPMLRVMGQCADNKGNECRNLHSAIHQSGKTLPVPVSTVPTKVLLVKGKPRVEQVQWPVLFLSDWARTIFGQGGHMLLGGHTLNDPAAFCSMLQTFWDRFCYVQPNHEVYGRANAGTLDLRFAIPIAIRGDEGRGKLKRPVMILSYQPLISVKGPKFVNSSGYFGL